MTAPQPGRACPVNLNYPDPQPPNLDLAVIIGHGRRIRHRRRLTQLGAVLAGEDHVSQHVVLAVVHQHREFGPARAQLIGNMPPGLVCCLCVGLQKSLADRSGNHGVLAPGHVRQGVPHPMHPTALPAGT